MNTARPIVAGVGLSHHERVLFPGVPATKLDLATYYGAIAEWVLPHLVDRPLTVVRCPNGVPMTGATKGIDCFYMKHSKVWAPPGIRRVRIREKTKVGTYLIVDTISALVGLVQMGVLEVHTWNAQVSNIEQPDRLVIDLDPGQEVGWPAVIAAARLVRQLLRENDGRPRRSYCRAAGAARQLVRVPGFRARRRRYAGSPSGGHVHDRVREGGT